MALSWITITPPGIERRITPCQISKPASVTTKDGTPTSATIDPWKAPISDAASSARKTQRYQGKLTPVGSCVSATTTPATPLTKLTERSISPIRRTKTTP